MSLPPEGCTYNPENDSDLQCPVNHQKIEILRPAPTSREEDKELSLEREVSSIPMAKSINENSFWVYPSEKMFFDAMKRKNWNPKEQDMHSIIPIHNAVNEKCWREIMKWESMHYTSCSTPKLLKFQGKPRDYTPKARFWNLLGYKLPFDRHDWMVDRCGEQVRYVIDFYAGTPIQDKPASFYLDVRPGLDSLSSIKDRLVFWWRGG